MALEGKYEWVKSSRKGGMPIISFVLTNNNFLMSENFSAVIINSLTGQAGIGFNNVKLDNGKSLRFDYDTVDWDFCQGDAFAIVDAKGNIKKHWTLQVPVMRPGECPECHGTHRCGACSGAGMIKNPTHMGGYERCMHCFGTGQCMICYVPVRTSASQHPDPLNPAPAEAAQRTASSQAEKLRARIRELEAKLQRADMDVVMYQLKGMDVANTTSYQAILRMRTDLAMQIDRLRYDLQSLEQC